MLTKTFIAAAAIAVAAGSASAATQLERSLGVEPGVYTTAQLVQLRTAIADENRDRIEFILSNVQQRMSTRSVQAVGSDDLSVAERQIVRGALEKNEFQRAEFVAEGGLSNAPTDTSFIAERLASSVGVDADDYTLSALIKLADERQD